MSAVLIVVVALAVVLGLLAILVRRADRACSERARIHAQVRRSERRLHELTRTSFEAMLTEARRQSTGSRR